MVKFVFNSAEIPFPFKTVVQTHWEKYLYIYTNYTLRYPHPQNPNVLCVDILDRRTGSDNVNTLQTTRLVTCVGVPSYISRLAPFVRPIMYNCEQSTVDRLTKTLTIQTFNVNLLNLFNLYEETIYTPVPGQDSLTAITQQYRISAKIWGFSTIIEKWAAGTCLTNAKRGREILKNICTQFESQVEKVKNDIASHIDDSPLKVFTLPPSSTTFSASPILTNDFNFQSILPAKISPNLD